MKTCLIKYVTLMCLGLCVACASGSDVSEMRVTPETTSGKGDQVIHSSTQTGADTQMNPEFLGCVQNLGASDTRHMRIVKVKIPTDPSEASALGCDVSAGSNFGSGLSGLVQALEFDLDALVSPSPEGVIPSVLIGSISGWSVGASDTQVSQLMFRLFGESEQSVDQPFSLEQPPSPIFEVPASVSCDQIASGHGRFDLGVPLTENSEPTPLTIEHAHLAGTLETGSLSILRGTLNGYLTRGSLRSIIEGLQEVCVDEPGSTVCSSVRASDVDQLIDFVATFVLKGFDTSLLQGGPTACNGDRCNAISVCIGFEAEAIELSTLE